MKLRTFTAPDMPAAMQMVRTALGEDAIIISSREVVNGKRSISVTAASDSNSDIDLHMATSAGRRDSAADDLRFELQNTLRFHNLPEIFIAKLMQQASDSDLVSLIALHRIGSNREPRYLHRQAIEKMLGAFFTFNPLPLDAKPSRLMLVGMPGIGKTLTIAKMAARLSMDGQPVTVITTDNKRAGGVEQLQAFTTILGLELKVATSQEELQTILKSLPMFTRVLVDTAGCNPYDQSDLRELRGYASVNGIEPVLVMPAGGDSLEGVDTAEHFASLPIKRLLVTQADSTRRFGSVLAAAASQGLAFCNISSSSSIIDTLQPADGALLAQLLLRYQLQS